MVFRCSLSCFVLPSYWKISYNIFSKEGRKAIDLYVSHHQTTEYVCITSSDDKFFSLLTWWSNGIIFTRFLCYVWRNFQWKQFSLKLEGIILLPDADGIHYLRVKICTNLHSNVHLWRSIPTAVFQESCAVNACSIVCCLYSMLPSNTGVLFTSFLHSSESKLKKPRRCVHILHSAVFPGQYLPEKSASFGIFSANHWTPPFLKVTPFCDSTLWMGFQTYELFGCRNWKPSCP